MTSEGGHFLRYLQTARDALFHELEALPEDGLNWPLQMPETNTMYASVFHAAQSAEYWLTVYVGQGARERDRPSEFRAAGDLGSLRECWQRCLDTAEAVVSKLDATAYDEEREVNLGGRQQRDTVRGCLLHILEHVNIHVGHVQLAHQLWAIDRTTSSR